MLYILFSVMTVTIAQYHLTVIFFRLDTLVPCIIYRAIPGLDKWTFKVINQN